MVGSAHRTNLLVLLEAGAQWISIALLNQSVDRTLQGYNVESRRVDAPEDFQDQITSIPYR